MINNNFAFFMVFAGYFGIFCSIGFLLVGVDFWYAIQYALCSLALIWLGKRIDRSLSTSKPMPK